MFEGVKQSVARTVARSLPFRGLGVFSGGLASVSGILPVLGGVCPFCLVGIPWCPICAVGAVPVVGGLFASAIGFFGLDSLRGRIKQDRCGTNDCSCNQ